MELPSTKQLMIWVRRGEVEAVHGLGLEIKCVCTMIDFHGAVNGNAYMGFKEATDGLFSRVDHEDLAKRLGVSVATIRQARLRPEANANRPAPKHWQETVIRMAEMQMMHFRRLIKDVRNQKAH